MFKYFFRSESFNKTPDEGALQPPNKPDQRLSLQDKDTSSNPDNSMSFSNNLSSSRLHDVEAKLICEFQQGCWQAYLTKIQGRRVEFILGKNYDVHDRLPLETLIPLHMRERHKSYFESVLNEGQRSPFWQSFFNKMSLKHVSLVNPVNGAKRHVVIELLSEADSTFLSKRYTFSVRMQDKTIYEGVALKAAAITHDIRGLAGQGLLLLSEHDSETSTALGQDLKNIFQQIIRQCQPRQQDFMEEEVEHRLQLEEQTVGEVMFAEIKLRSFILTIAKIYESKVAISFSAQGIEQCSITQSRENCLESFLLNLIKNAIEARAQQLLIECLVLQKNSRPHFAIHFQDNGCGMSKVQMDGFFSRIPKIASSSSIAPMEESISDILRNRGEGTMLAFQQLEIQGGGATVQARLDGQPGTAFCFFVPATVLTRIDFGCRESSIKLLLIDDSFFQIQMMLHHLFQVFDADWEAQKSYLAKNKATWSSQGVMSFSFGDVDVICASCGELGFQFMKSYETTGLITDMRMPKSILQGDELIAHVTSPGFNHCPHHMAICSADVVSLPNVQYIEKSDRNALKGFVEKAISSSVTYVQQNESKL